MKSSCRATRREFVGAAALATAPMAAFSQHEKEQRFKIIGFTKPFQKLNFEGTADTVAEVGWDGMECPVLRRAYPGPFVVPTIT